jgi:23S rRNA pseudouridine955/2504/2580 synthase
MTLTAEKDDGGRRLDRILRRALPDMPLSGIHRLLRRGQVLVNGRPAAAKDRIAEGSTITLPALHSPVPTPHPSPPTLSTLHPSSLHVLREDPDLLFLNKASGLAVHGPGSLDEQVRAYLAEKIPPSLSFRPGPLHRLDKPTSGVIVFSKTLEGARSFSALSREGRVTKQYLALVEGRVTKAAVWEDTLVRDQTARKTFSAGDGAETAKEARTRIRPLASAAGKQPFSLILAELDTGRTHQIRAQAAARGFPLAGDKKYGGGPRAGGFLLHAWKLELPGTGGEPPRTVRAPLPERFRQGLEEIFGMDAEKLIEAAAVTNREKKIHREGE